MKKGNLFLKFVSKYTDDELLNSVDHPDEFEKEVYDAILSESLRRNLISKLQYDERFVTGKGPERGQIQPGDQTPVNIGDYWKCPKCGEIVEMDFKICWNCQKSRPKKIIRPSTAKIIDCQSNGKQPNFFMNGFVLIGLGIFILFLSYSMTLPDFWGFHYLPLGKFLAGIAFIIIGFLFMLYGIFKGLTK
jgi:rubredoxin